MKNKGFTLVELSIVLVIIGLLIGGILVAQSMISTVKAQKFIGQITQIETAIVNFQTKYNALPGDNRLFGNTGITVDGKILNSVGTYTGFSGEIGRFWYDLSVSGLKTETGALYTDNSGGGTLTAEVNVPTTNLGKNTGIKVYYADWMGNGAPSQNLLMIEDYKNGTYAMNSRDIFAIDTKIDDGFNYITQGQVFAAGQFSCDYGAPPTYGKYQPTNGDCFALLIGFGLFKAVPQSCFNLECTN